MNYLAYNYALYVLFINNYITYFYLKTNMNSNLKFFFLIILIALVVNFSFLSEINEEKPNIVWLVTEDNSVHYMNLYTEGGAEMPVVANLANEGVIFDNAFSNAPVCSVARSTIITGAYAPRIGTQYHRKSSPVNLPENIIPLPIYLKELGYYTTNNAKEDYNFQTDLLMLPKTKQGYKYLLVIVDLFTNEVDFEAMKTKTPAETLRSMKVIFKRDILNKPFASMSSDAGLEFKGTFKDYLYNQSILHRIEANLLQTWEKWSSLGKIEKKLSKPLSVGY